MKVLIWQHRHRPVYSVILNLSLYNITTQLHFKTNKQQQQQQKNPNMHTSHHPMAGTKKKKIINCQKAG